MADKHDIQHSILELQSKKARLGIKKATIQQAISNNKEMLRYVEQGCETFEELVNKKRELICELNNVEADMVDVKRDIKKRQLLKDEVSEMEQPKAKMYEVEVTVMRDTYLKFAGDKTRVASLRSMAAEFAEQLTKLLKKVK